MNLMNPVSIIALILLGIIVSTYFYALRLFIRAIPHTTEDTLPLLATPIETPPSDTDKDNSILTDEYTMEYEQ